MKRLLKRRLADLVLVLLAVAAVAVLGLITGGLR
jgi:hypothetical protein